jgi:hypothetical protein
MVSYIEQNLMFVAEITITPPKGDIEPILPRHHHEKENKSAKKIMWDNESRRGVYTSVHIIDALNGGHWIHKVHKIMVWEKHGKVFAPWMSKCLTEKDNTTGGLRQMWKTITNSSYGINLKRNYNSTQKKICNAVDLQDYLRNNIIKEVTWLKKSGECIVMGERVQDKSLQFSRTVEVWGAFVLAYSIRHMHALITKCYGGKEAKLSGKRELAMNQIAYGDTDSIFTHSSMLQSLQSEFGSTHGKLTDDLEDDTGKAWKVGMAKDPQQLDIKNWGWAKIVGYSSFAPKAYGLVYILPDGTIKQKTKIKGISKRGVTFEQDDEDIGKRISYRSFAKCARGVWKNLDDDVITMNKRGAMKKFQLRIPRKENNAGVGIYDIMNEDRIRRVGQNKNAGRDSSKIEELRGGLLPWGYVSSQGSKRALAN